MFNKNCRARGKAPSTAVPAVPLHQAKAWWRSFKAAHDRELINRIRYEVPARHASAAAGYLLRATVAPNELSKEAQAIIEKGANTLLFTFDRMLIAQSLVEDLAFLTADPMTAKYPCSVRLV